VRRIAGKRQTKYLGQIKKLKLATNGYHCVSLDNIWERLHRQIAHTFLGKCPDGHVVNHKDGDKTNNRLDNLEYVTPKVNTQHMLRVLGKRRGMQCGGGGRPMFTHEQVREIRKKLREGHSQLSLARTYKVSSEAIRYIYIRRSYAYVTDD
jgi:hypothetical protein